MPSDEYPLLLSTGRQVYHFHTRTKTGRDRHLAEAGGDSFVQVSEADAAEYGIGEGDLVLVESARGKVEVRARVGRVEAGQVFLPFHFGYWDGATGRARAANELTRSTWDPVSKQPLFKSGAVRISRLPEVKRHGEEEVKTPPVSAPELQSAAVRRAQQKQAPVTAATDPQPGRRHRHLADALLSFAATVDGLAKVYGRMAEAHAADVEMRLGLRVVGATGE